MKNAGDENKVEMKKLFRRVYTIKVLKILQGRPPGVVFSNGKYWKEQRKFLTRYAH